ncbi:hypothetical protein ACFO3Q_15080 [Coralloluteibacterium thermophilus]|uniref:XRE family transcriptional regulator n=1 Tax=Coralloluteibacterium thermophilum TaxID=2707049 RepID=A0ABV9NQS7_9GAMM
MTKDLIRDRDLSLKEVALRLGYRADSIRTLLCDGHKTGPTPQLYNRILDALEATPQERALVNRLGAEERGWRLMRSAA